MNKMKLFLMLMAFPVLGNAQSRVLSDVYHEYSHLEEAFTLSISGSFLNMADWFDSEWDDDDKSNIAESIDNIRILKVPIGRNGMSDREIDQFKKDVLNDRYDEFMNVKSEDGGKFYVLAREKKGVVTNLIMYGKGDDGVIFIELTGSMNSKKVAEFCREIEMDRI